MTNILIAFLSASLALIINEKLERYKQTHLKLSIINLLVADISSNDIIFDNIIIESSAGIKIEPSEIRLSTECYKNCFRDFTCLTETTIRALSSYYSKAMILNNLLSSKDAIFLNSDIVLDFSDSSKILLNRLVIEKKQAQRNFFIDYCKTILNKVQQKLKGLRER